MSEVPKYKNERPLSEKDIDFGFVARKRFAVQVSHRPIDTTIETEQGKDEGVAKLFQDYVLGKLDPRQIAGGVYDDDNAEDVDPMNNFGITLEESSAIQEAGHAAATEIQRSMKEKRQKLEQKKLEQHDAEMKEKWKKENEERERATKSEDK